MFLAMTVSIPLIGARRYNKQLNYDFLDDNDFLRGSLVEIATMSQDDANYIIGFTPWLVSEPTITEASIDLNLNNPTGVTGESGNLISRYFNEQDLTPEIPYTWN